MEKQTPAVPIHPATPVKQINPLRFRDTLKDAWNIYKKHFLLMTGIVLIVNIVTFAIAHIVQNSIVTMVASRGSSEGSQTALVLLITIVLSLVTSLISLIGMAAVLRAAYLSESNQPSLQEGFSFGFRRIYELIVLSLRVFLYSGAWLFIFLAALPFLAIVALTFVGPIVAPLLAILPILLIVAFFIYIRRILKSTFAYSIFCKNETISSKEALEESKVLANDIMGDIFKNYFFLVIIAWIFFTLLAGVMSTIALSVFKVPPTAIRDAASAIDPTDTIVTILMLLPTTIAGAFGTLFTYALMKRAIAAKGNIDIPKGDNSKLPPNPDPMSQATI